MKRTFLVTQLAIVLSVLTFSTSAFAAGKGGFNWINWAWGMFNFAVFLGILYKFALPLIQEHFAQRRENLVNQLEEATRMREEAEARVAEYEQKVKALDDERQKLRDEYHAQGMREKTKLVEDAKKQIEKMRKDAEVVIQQETRKAVASLEQQAVDLALGVARTQLSSKIDESAQNTLVDQYVADLKEMN